MLSQSQLSLKEVCFTDTSQEIAHWSKRPACPSFTIDVVFIARYL